MSKQTKETKLAKEVIEYFEALQEKGEPLYFEHRSGSGGYAYEKGIPDLFFVYDGVHVECELKAPNGKLSTMQEKWKWKCEWIWEVPYLCPRTLDEVKEVIEIIKRGATPKKIEK